MYPRQNMTILAARGLLLYLLTILADVVSIAIRYWIGSTLSQIVVCAVAPASAQTFPSYIVGLIFAFAPVAWGMIALLGLPSDSTLTRYELAGRIPNAQEQEIVERTLALLLSIHPGIRRPRTWFVSNTIEPGTLAIGTTLYISSDLLHRDQQYLTAFLAHALGHLNTLDSCLIEALKRLKIRVVYFLVYALDSLDLGAFKRRSGLGFAGEMGGGFIVILDIALTLIAGGLGLRITSPFWRAYFHTCEYAADGYAVSLGQAQALASAVDNLNPPLDVPFDWMWDRAGTSKYVQKRLALLRQQPPTQKTKEQWLDESKALIERKLYWEALAACEQALRLDPNDAKAYNIKSVALRNLQRFEEALAACEQTLRLDPTSLNAYDTKARILAHLRLYEEALAAYDQIMRLDPNVAAAYVNKGDIFLGLQRYEEALAVCEQALRLDPNNAVAYVNKGQAFASLQRYEEALAAYDQTLRLDPTYVNAHIYKGRVLAHLKRYEEALAAFDQALRLDPTYVNAHVYKGRVLESLGKKKEAQQAYEKARQLYRG